MTTTTPQHVPHRHRAGNRALGALLNLALLLTMLFVGIAVAATLTGARISPVLSGSMSPTIDRNALVLARPVESTRVRVGDVVLFRRPDAAAADPLVMHRVVRLTDRGPERIMKTRGDANTADDPWAIDLNASGLYRVEGSVPGVGAAYGMWNRTVRDANAARVWPGVLLLIGAAALGRWLRRRHRADAAAAAERAYAATVAERALAEEREREAVIERARAADERARLAAVGRVSAALVGGGPAPATAVRAGVPAAH
ncbi:hypothetical protein GCM10010123_15860 [Pilimelia anulata]|uniref:Signal peptidase I n=1 Tax=Pilimelia anulata TaxID=53371 RepID=A0A8J3B2H1_9ACTN|nr:signal peptidase I [Pilimelia anulata]GGJ87076.1 hypothetical protein GCM10010123_15860 [Pilimelia anulata]